MYHDILTIKNMKLHLGCGTKKLCGFTNIDIDPSVHPDIVDDIAVLSSIPDDSADLIYACHVLEHFQRHKWKNVLTVWVSKLKTGGILRISVPSFEAVVLWYAQTGNIADVMGLVCGGQRNHHDFHFVVFDRKTLTSALLDLGMTNVKDYDWKETEHATVDDYSQAYLPHMDKTSGVLMSLNIEATKGRV